MPQRLAPESDRVKDTSMPKDLLVRLLNWMTPTIAPDVHGRVELRAEGSSRAAPAAQIEVVMLAWDGMEWQSIDAVRTDDRGEYHFRNVTPGEHALLIRNRRYAITVTDVPRVDIDPIVLS